MTNARVDTVPGDKIRAREFLDQAERFSADAQVAGLRPESRATLLHNAAMCACGAILQAVGMCTSARVADQRRDRLCPQAVG